MEGGTQRNQKLVAALRWTARGWSAATVVLVLAFIVGEGLKPSGRSGWLEFLLFPLGISLGMILAWWDELLGGSITVGSLLAFYLVHRATAGTFPRGWAWLTFAAPGFLFLLSSHWSRRGRSEADPLKSRPRPLAFEKGKFLWNIQRVPPTLPDGRPHPGRTSAIFVVHGIGQQCWTETAAQLRAGFEDALEDIVAWQMENLKTAGEISPADFPPPFVYYGYWADYDDIKETFPDDWKRFAKREQEFFGHLWKDRVVSGARTVFWMLRQQLRLLHTDVLHKVGRFAWILYWPLQIVSITTLGFAWFRNREAITGFLNDVRLYLEPQGVVERAIVQRIDYRVGQMFLQMIGLDWEFRPLPPDQWLEAGGESLTFQRVVWVAHSLGTVISYNVLSALFQKAAALDLAGDVEQKQGIALFRSALTRFVTMGSPLDKVAFLYKQESLRPWPWPEEGRRAMLKGGEFLNSKDPSTTEWWVNFYHVFDPVSGALQSPFICGNQPPSNLHIRSGWIPGLAHIAYWKDRSTLRFILGRTYGASYLQDQEYQPWSPTVLSALAALGYFTWMTILFGAVIGGGYLLYHFGPSLLQAIGNAALKWIVGS